MRKILCGWLILALTIVSGCSQSEQRLKPLPKSSYYLSDKHRTDFKEILERTIRTNDVKDQELVGFAYLYGMGIEPNGEKSIEWLEKASQQKSTDAMIQLGNIYRDGMGGISQNGYKAIEWYKKAASLDAQAGYYNLGELYEVGKGGIIADPQKAREWYEKGSLQGHSRPQYRLGLCYEKGQCGLSVDYTQAKKWYEKAAKGNHINAQDKIKSAEFKSITATQ